MAVTLCLAVVTPRAREIPLAQRKGAVKDVQGVMRHTRVATTTDIYMQDCGGSARNRRLHPRRAA